MTHDELLTKVRSKAELKEVGSHRPTIDDRYGDTLFCSGCSDLNIHKHVLYPCPTIQAIEKELK